MADFLSDLASNAGVSSDEAQQGLGALLAMLKGKLSPDAFARLQGAIPGGDDMLESAEEKAQAGEAGLLEGLKSMAGKILGGGAKDPAAAQQSDVSSAGLSGDQLKSLLPKLHELLTNKLPTHVLAQIEEHVPGFGPAEEEPVSKRA
jgi:hypothetical protein